MFFNCWQFQPARATLERSAGHVLSHGQSISERFMMIKFKPYLMQCKCGTGHNRASVLTRNRFYFYFLKMKFSCRRSQLLLSNGFVAFREVVEHKKKEQMTIIPTSKLWAANKNCQQRNATRNHCKSEFAENTDDKENVAFENLAEVKNKLPAQNW